jgi:hypothetical protein
MEGLFILPSGDEGRDSAEWLAPTHGDGNGDLSSLLLNTETSIFEGLVPRSQREGLIDELPTLATKPAFIANILEVVPTETLSLTLTLGMLTLGMLITRVLLAGLSTPKACELDDACVELLDGACVLDDAAKLRDICSIAGGTAS